MSVTRRTHTNVLWVTLFLLLAFTGQTQAKDITLAWDKNPEADVVGYKVYYKAEASSQPLNGWGANEGDSPITVGNTTTARITGLMDSQTYYFAVSAYNAAGVESPLSDIVASAAVPILTSPGRGEVGVRVPVTFRWDYPYFANGMSYTLLLGTDSQLPVTATQLAALPTEGSLHPAFVGLFGLGLLGGGLSLRRSRVLACLLWSAVLFSLAACGGGGSGGEGTPASGVAVTNPAAASSTKVFNKLTTPFVTVSDLQPGTTYYWQVQVVDARGYRYESLVHSFTTVAR